VYAHALKRVRTRTHKGFIHANLGARQVSATLMEEQPNAVEVTPVPSGVNSSVKRKKRAYLLLTADGESEHVSCVGQKAEFEPRTVRKPGVSL
jgi:hypothetical protein